MKRQMERCMAGLLIAFLLISCSNKAEISVFNNSEVDRQNELVEICLCSLKRVDPAKLLVVDSLGHPVPLQLLYKGEKEPQAFVFPVTLKAGQKAIFSIKEGQPVQQPAKTYVRQVPERKDDIAWENDRIAFRVYGPALAAENPSNGIDVWYKRTDSLVINKWYKNDLSGKATYHEDHGEGLDCYKVGHTLGAGAIAPYTEDSVWVFGHYNRFTILDCGSLRSSFVLFYDAVPYNGHTLSAEVRVTLDAGSNLNEVTVRFSGDTTQLRLAAGIICQDANYVLSGNVERGYIGYAADARTQTNPSKPAGRGYVGMVFLNRLTEMKQVNGHILGISLYTQGEDYRYYTGAGWENGGFKTDQAWFNYLAEQYKAKSNPLQVKITK